MTCFELEDVAAAYFEGVLAFEEEREFHRHLAECDDCLAHSISYHWVLLLLNTERNRFRRI